MSSSYGHEGAHGTAACQPERRTTSRSSSGSWQKSHLPAESSYSGMGGIASKAMIWLCGWSIVAPTARPRFSKTNT